MKMVMEKTEITYENSSRCCLSRNKFAGPVLGLCHKSALELFALAGGLLFLLLGVIWGEFWLLSTAEEGERPPEEDDQQTS